MRRAWGAIWWTIVGVAFIGDLYIAWYVRLIRLPWD